MKLVRCPAPALVKGLLALAMASGAALATASTVCAQAAPAVEPLAETGAAPVAGPGVEGSWELGLDASFQRLSDGIVSTETRLATAVGWYGLTWLEPLLGISVDVQHLDGGHGANGTATQASMGLGARASTELIERVRGYLVASPGFLIRTTDTSGFDHAGQTDFSMSAGLGVQVVLVPHVALDLSFDYDRIFSHRGEDLLTVPIGLSVFF